MVDEMRKKIICVVAAFILVAVTTFNVKTVLEVNRVYDIAMTSFDALSENANGEGSKDGESETGKYEYPNGYPYSSICQGRGSECNSKKCPIHKS